MTQYRPAKVRRHGSTATLDHRHPPNQRVGAREPRPGWPADIQRLVERSTSELEFNITDRLTIETFIRADDEQERLEKARNIVEEIL